MSKLVNLVKAFRRLRLSPVWRERTALGATGVWAGAFSVLVTDARWYNTLPCYPEVWCILLAVVVAGLRMFSPRLATMLAILGFVLPVADNLPAAFVPVCLVLAVTLPADCFLVLSVLVFLLPRDEWLLPAVPLLAGFLKMNRSVVTAGLACLVAEFTLLLSGRVPTSGAGGFPLVQLQTAVLPSLKDFHFGPVDFYWFDRHNLKDWDWLLTNRWSTTNVQGQIEGGWTKLGEVFGSHPQLLGHVLVWLLAALVVAWLLRQPANRFAPVRVVAVGGGALALVLGSFFLSSFVGPSVMAKASGLGSILAGAGLVMLLAPAWITTVSALAAKSESGSDAQAGSKETSNDDDWGELVGMDEIQTEVREAVRSHFDPAERESLRRLSLQPPKGVLFFGPPGTGKTKLARLIAREAKAAFYTVSGAEFTSKWFGESEANLRNIFQTAREHRPAVLFFDELEAFLPHRTEMSRADAPEKSIVATFLAYTDGIAALDGVFLVGATNHPELIDPAALRAGRFDKIIYVSAPDAAARRCIFEHYLKDLPLAEDVNFDKLAALTERFTGADIQTVCREAILETVVRRQQLAIPMSPLVNFISGTKPSLTLELQRNYVEIADRIGRSAPKSKKVEVVHRVDVGWEDVAGLDSVKKALHEAIEMPLTHGEVLLQYGVKPPKGVLLYGPPGCGKTLLAKVIARVAKANFVHVKGPEILRGMTGQSETKLRELFDRARESAPCVLFFDEIDALAGARGTVNASHTQILNQFLTEMDGMDELKGVVVVGATNRPDILDEALLRPGRFDRLLYVPPPDRAARTALFQHTLHGKPLALDIDPTKLADLTEGYSCVDITTLCNQAAITAVEDVLTTGQIQDITMARLEKQIQRTPSSLGPAAIALYEKFRTQFQR